MAIVKTHRQVVYRLLPQTHQNWRWLEMTLEAQRQLWNDALAERIDCYRKTGRSITYFDQCRSATECRRDIPAMADCPLRIQRGTLKRLDEAYRHFFRRTQKGGAPGFPKFKGKPFFNSMSIVSGVKVRDGTLHIPSFGALKLQRKVGNPYPDGRPVSAVLKREAGKWTAIVCYAVELEEPTDNGIVLGLDRNGGQVADSDGVLHEMPDMKRLDGKAWRLQRQLSRRKKGSKRRERTKRHLAKVQRKKAQKRHDWHHHVSKALAVKAGSIAVEGLNVKGMTRSAKGTVEDPGRNVAAKSGTNRVILNTGWTALKRKIDYKAANVIVVPAMNTSRTCHECGVVDSDSRSTRDDFICMACGHAAHADLNAAKNIREKALERLCAMEAASGTGASARRGALGLPTPTTREFNRGDTL